jgi:aminoglycoside/choline kinase family phosphotransferase
MTARFDTLSAWLATQRPGQTFTLKPASSDASFRRYFRATFADGATAIVMDAPPEHENCEPFVRVSGLLAAAGVHVPRVHAQDLQQGFLLLDDLGSTTYLAGLTEDKARALYLDAIDALVLIQQAAGGDSLPPYDEALLTREMNLFPEWFASRHLGKPFDHDTLTVWKDAQRLLLDAIQAQPRVLVHRDYHCRNLMVSQPNPGVLDFQDAVYGPLTYDLVSLLKDAYLEWPEEFILDMVIRL